MKVITKKIIDPASVIEGEYNLKKLIFLRINPEDKVECLRKIYERLSDKSWISRFKQAYIRKSYESRVNKTLKVISDNLNIGVADKITSEAGEYLVSELSRETIIDELNYSDIPLDELRKEQKKSNPGFDFHSESIDNLIIFGESKYLSRDNAYGSALSQIVDFIKNDKDLDEIAELEKFVSVNSLENFEKGNKGYAAAFSAHSIEDRKLIENIMKNDSFSFLLNYDELILLAVNVNE